MKMPFDVEIAVDNVLKIFTNLEDFYRTYSGEQLAFMKVEDSYFIVCHNGVISQEYNNEGHNKRPYNPDPNSPHYNPSGDHKFSAVLCNVKHCHLTEDDIKNSVRMFLENIPPIGS